MGGERTGGENVVEKGEERAKGGGGADGGGGRRASLKESSVARLRKWGF